MNEYTGPLKPRGRRMKRNWFCPVCKWGTRNTMERDNHIAYHKLAGDWQEVDGSGLASKDEA